MKQNPSRSYTHTTHLLLPKKKKKEGTCEGRKDFPAFYVQVFLLGLSPRVLSGFCVDEHMHHLLSLDHSISILQTGLLA